MFKRENSPTYNQPIYPQKQDVIERLVYRANKITYLEASAADTIRDKNRLSHILKVDMRTD